MFEAVVVGQIRATDCLVNVAEDAVVLASGIEAAPTVVDAAATADPQIQFVVWGMQYLIAQVAPQALAYLGYVIVVVAVIAAGEMEIAKAVVVVRIL